MNKKFEKGITLIALIITIIILLILAVVTIGSIKDSNIIAYAQNASTDYNVKKTEEEEKLSGYETLIGTHISGENVGTDTELSSDPTIAATTIIQAQSELMLTKTVNSNITDKYNNKITVPAGFKILVDGTTGYTADNLDVTKGIVITDGTNEFVWVPVGENITNGTKIATITLGRYSNFVADAEGNYTPVADGAEINGCEELQSSEFIATAKNLSDFLIKTRDKGGYYIGRYEASYITENDVTKLTCRKDAQVLLGETQSNASNYCQTMYINKPFISDLTNSYAWDTAIIFIQTFGGCIDYYKQNFSNPKTFSKTGGTADKYCNICEMSGNASEWSTEFYQVMSGIPCVFRGGSTCDWNSAFDNIDTTSYRCSGAWTGISGLVYSSFRPILYIGE